MCRFCFLILSFSRRESESERASEQEREREREQDAEQEWGDGRVRSGRDVYPEGIKSVRESLRGPE